MQRDMLPMRNNIGDQAKPKRLLICLLITFGYVGELLHAHRRLSLPSERRALRKLTNFLIY